jgi:putative heme-binding domain-containing protein
VVAASKDWVASLDPKDPEYDRLRCEALWVQASHHAVDEALLASLLKSKTWQARSAATHVVADERAYLPNALDLLAGQTADENSRVRLQAVRGLSFFKSMDAVNAALKVLESPMDSWLNYTLEHTLVALEPVWTDEYSAGTLSAGNGSAEFIDRMLAARRPGLVAATHLKALVDPASGDSAKLRAYVGIESLHGEPKNGLQVFRRVCASCHKIDDVGFNFGPELSDVGKRLSRREIHESLIEPSKKVDPKYVATTVITTEGLTEIGLVVEKTDDAIILVGGDGRQKKIPTDEIDEMEQTNVSSMPENLVSSLSPGEFLDVVEYLTTLDGEDERDRHRDDDRPRERQGRRSRDREDRR